MPRRKHGGLFAKIGVLFWRNDRRVRLLTRAQRADYAWLLTEVVIQGRENVCFPEGFRQAFVREWAAKRQTIARSLAAMCRGDDPLVKVIDDCTIWVCGYAAVLANPSTGEGPVLPYVPSENHPEPEPDLELDQEPEPEGEVSHIHERSNDDTAEATSTPPSMEGVLEKARLALKSLTAGWPARTGVTTVVVMLRTRPKEVLAHAKSICQKPEGLGNKWAVLGERLTRGWDPPKKCVVWAEEVLRA